ncbi:MAG: shikimate kinase [Clostridiales bacterium]|jgi:shikimate kinase|nr:shikimate kinase [Clostridiales bacterium]MDN5283367.1 shikimate kinase [Candidatus Ozemobacter sp.]
MHSILLTGFMASGKTTAGSLVAAKTNLKFIDTDELISKRMGLNIAEIFSKFGEPEFRRIENEVFTSILKSDSSDAIISTGGGLLLNQLNISSISEHPVVFLDTEFALVQQRILVEISTRPVAASLDQAGLEKLFHSRREKYLELADFVVQNSEELEKLVNKMKMENDNEK